MNRSHLSKKSAFSMVELLVVIAIIGILASLLLPALGRAKNQGSNAVCINQLRQLGAAARLYSDDNNNLLPRAELLPTSPVDPAHPLPRICDVLAPDAGKTSGTNSAPVFKCPSDTLNRFANEGSSYEWNIELNGHRIDETRSENMNFMIVIQGPDGTTQQTNGAVQLMFPPATTPLFLDYDDAHPRSASSGKNVVFMDGHVTALVLADTGE
ncbi:MAG TPA: type II secretion system protein [Verrucomicrobiae bacterium]|jgi:prepilin-type N-terminal cleavage/methylation domain-containing protein/prepilin-type processing-associated H-X9-DG protein